MQNVPIQMQKHRLPVPLPTMWAAHARWVQDAKPQVHSRGDVTVETQTFRPTPFQVMELSLQQEEALPGSGPSQGSPAWYPVSHLAEHPVMVPGAAGASRGMRAWQSPRCRPGTSQRSGSAGRLGRRGRHQGQAGERPSHRGRKHSPRRPLCLPVTALGLPQPIL